MRRGGVLFAGVALALLGGAGRLGYIEYRCGDRLRAQAARQQSATVDIPAMRGEILDVRGRVLAGSTRWPSIYVDPSMVSDPRFAAYRLAPLPGLDPAALGRRPRGRRGRPLGGRGRPRAWPWPTAAGRG